MLTRRGFVLAAAGLPGLGAAKKNYIAVDPRWVERTENARLVPGEAVKEPRNPLFVEDRPWEVRYDNLYANVLHDPEDHLYKCWYSPFIMDEATALTPVSDRARIRYLEALKGRKREMGVCYATSRDGLEWKKPALGLVELNGSKANNLVIRGPHGAGVIKDAREPDPERRYKMFLNQYADGAHRSMAVAFSPDGLHWSEPLACPEMEAKGDTHNNAFWSEPLGRYVAITRFFRDGQRIVARSESADFRKWSRAEEVLRGDTAHQTYAMPVFPYAGGYLGLPMIFHREPDTVDCELAWSADTVTWQRLAPGMPLIRRGEEGSCDSGCIYAAAYPVILENEIRLYYAGSDGPHTAWRKGSLCLARLRTDGFAAYEPVSHDAAARLITAPLRLEGPVKVNSEGGEVRVSVLGSGRIVPALAGKTVQLVFELRNARLYGFHFGG